MPAAALLITLTALAAPSTPATTRDLPVATGIRDLDAMVVTGNQSGPRMWKVSRGDHVMWVLGTLSPMPEKMRWQSGEVEAIVAGSQEVIWEPMIGVQVKAGVFGGLMLLPGMIRVRSNPDGESLQDQLPPELYTRWLALKDDYIGFDWGIDNYRPVFAAMKLWEEAMDQAGMTSSSPVVELVGDLVKQHGIRSTRPREVLVIDDARAAMGEFRKSALDDVRCFEQTVARLETDLQPMRERIDAWAVGDIEALRALPYTDQEETCQAALMQAQVVQHRLDHDLVAEATGKWFEAVDAALARNDSTFALLPVSDLLKPDGYLARLGEKGYTVEASLPAP